MHFNALFVLAHSLMPIKIHLSTAHPNKIYLNKEILLSYTLQMWVDSFL